MIEVKILKALKDNYVYLLHDPLSKQTAVIDPSDEKVVLKELKNLKRQLNYIFITHHHWDHIGGNLKLKEATGCQIIGAKKDKMKIPGIDQMLEEGDSFKFGDTRAEIIETPGHTKGSICWYFKDESILFTGDTLFSLGCGRLFEGTAKQMLESLQKIKNLPTETKIYCGHEYTLQNAYFALSLDQDDQNLKDKIKDLEKISKAQTPSIPSFLSEELLMNPFLKTDKPSLQKKISPENLEEWEYFSLLRKMKDNY